MGGNPAMNRQVELTNKSAKAPGAVNKQKAEATTGALRKAEKENKERPHTAEKKAAEKKPAQ